MKRNYSKICNHCKKPFVAKSEKAIYCSDGCRVMAHKIRKGIPLPVWKQKEIVNRIITPTEQALSERLSLLQRLEYDLNSYISNYANNRYRDEYKAIDANIKKIDYSYQFRYLYLKKSNLLELVNFFENHKLFSYYKSAPYREKQQVEEKIVSDLKIFYLNNLSQKKKHLSLQAKQELKENEEYIVLQNKIDELKDEIDQLHKGCKVDDLYKSGQVIRGDDIVQRLDGGLIQSYELSEEYDKVFGNPAIPFIAMIHGKQGSGKSTFLIGFSAYFNNCIQKMCYISLEESAYSLSFANKMKNAKFGTFDVIENITIPKLKELTKTYAMIVIDSVSHARYTYSDIADISVFGKNNNCSFIFIFHETKDGEYKGESSFAHLVDIQLKAEDGKVYVEKNRYLSDKSSFYEIFQK